MRGGPKYAVAFGQLWHHFLLCGGEWGGPIIYTWAIHFLHSKNIPIQFTLGTIFNQKFPKYCTKIPHFSPIAFHILRYHLIYFYTIPSPSQSVHTIPNVFIPYSQINFPSNKISQLLFFGIMTKYIIIKKPIFKSNVYFGFFYLIRNNKLISNQHCASNQNVLMSNAILITAIRGRIYLLSYVCLFEGK